MCCITLLWIELVAVLIYDFTFIICLVADCNLRQTALITQPVNIAGTVCTADNDFVDRTAGIYPNIMTAPAKQTVNICPLQVHIAVAQAVGQNQRILKRAVLNSCVMYRPEQINSVTGNITGRNLTGECVEAVHE